MFSVRRANLADIPILSRHRCEMWRDMGILKDETVYQEMIRQCAPIFEGKLNEGNYIAFVLYLTDEPETVVAGGALELRSVLPFPDANGKIFPTKVQAHIVNVFTEQAFRRKGLGKLVMQTLLDWCEEKEIRSITLNASNEGQPLYEGLGFQLVPNFMRLNRL